MTTKVPGPPINASDILHIVPSQDGEIHWVYLRDGSVMQWAPATGQIYHARSLPSMDELFQALRDTHNQ